MVSPMENPQIAMDPSSYAIKGFIKKPLIVWLSSFVLQFG